MFEEHDKRQYMYTLCFLCVGFTQLDKMSPASSSCSAVVLSSRLQITYIFVLSPPLISCRNRVGAAKIHSISMIDLSYFGIPLAPGLGSRLAVKSVIHCEMATLTNEAMLSMPMSQVAPSVVLIECQNKLGTQSTSKLRL